MGETMRRRWGDNDHYLGPFTFAFRERYRHTAVMLSSGEDEYPGASLRISAFGNTMIMAVPGWLIRPYRTKVFPNWDEATVARLGRDWYWDVDQREYGFTLSEGHLSVRLGRQTNDSSTTQDWGCFLPWTQWRFIRHSLYGADGSLFAHLKQGIRYDSPERVARDDLEKSCPTVEFAFKDFDGEEIIATTKIEEREWKFGTGYFKWLSLFRRPKVRRVLDLSFSAETGRRKGSWKGGTVGHSIEMLPGELHEAAFRRYCAAHQMTFVASTTLDKG